MKFSEQLWSDYYTDALASLYNPFVVGLATGTLPNSSFVEYIQQDSFYLDAYEGAYKKAIELSHANGYKEYENYFSELIKGIYDEKSKHQERAAARNERIEQKVILRATKGYTELLKKAYTEGSLAEIAAAVCPCTKLYGFIGHEIAKAFPTHHHKYSEWIDAYSFDGILDSTGILDEIIDGLVTEANESSLRHFYSEAMRLEFEFFNQQNHVSQLLTTNLHSLFAGSLKECHCDAASLQPKAECDEEGLVKYVRELGEESKASKGAEWEERIREMSEVYGKVYDREWKQSRYDMGYGSITDIEKILKCDVKVVVVEDEKDCEVLKAFGYPVKRFFLYDASQKDCIYFVKSVFEVGMMSIGTAFYPNQQYNTLPSVLIIAGSDSCGGAGLQADIKACTALHVYSSTVVAALTAQNTQGVQDIFTVPMPFIAKQIDSVLKDVHVDCVKTGMLSSVEVVEGVVRKMKEYGIKKLVVDPVMVSRSGFKLLDDDAVDVIKKQLLPIAFMITPNFYEAQLLLGRSIAHTEAALLQAARELQQYGCKNVYLKGGCLEGSEDCLDVLCDEDGACYSFKVPFVYSRNTHGTGCTLASSIAAEIARGLPVRTAVEKAKAYVNGAIQESRYLYIGKGKQGPLNHMYQEM